MRLLLASSRRFFHRHPGQLLLALIGMAAGVAVMTGVALMQTVLVDSLDGAARMLAGQDSVRISAAHGPLDETVYVQLVLTPGAPPLTPVLRQRLLVDGQTIELTGMDPLAGDGRGLLPPDLLTRLMTLPAAATANAATFKALDRQPGELLALKLGERRLDVELVGPVAAGRGLDNHLIMDIAVLQAVLDRRGELSWIDAPADAGPWLDEHLPDSLQLASASDRRDSAARLTEGMRANLSAMAMISLAVGLFVIFSVLSFLLVQRQRSLAMLRAVGVTGAQVMALLTIETLVIAGLGALLGLNLGTLLASRLVELVRAPAAELYGLLPPAGVEPQAGLYVALWLTAVTAAILTVTGLLAEARRIPPGQTLRQTRQPGRTLGAFGLAASGVLLAFGGALVLSTHGLTAAFIALFAALGGVALLTPGMGIALLALLARLMPAELPAKALALLLAGQRRIRPALAALSLALALSAGLAMMVLGFRAAVDHWIDHLLRADSYVSASHGTLDRATIEKIEELPGIAYTSTSRHRTGPDGREVIGYGLPARGWQGFEWLSGDPDSAYRAVTSNKAAIVSEPLARRERLQVGDDISLATPGGEYVLPVAGIYRDYASERGTVAIHDPLYRRLYDDDLVDRLALYYHDGPVDENGLARQIHALDGDLRFIRRDSVYSNTLAVFDRTFRISWALALLVGIIAVIALVSALLALGLERRRDYATLRALGLTPVGLHGLVVCQTAGLALTAALVAVPLAVAIHLGLSLIIQPRAFGWSLPLSWPLVPVLVMVPLALLTGAAAGLYPAWQIGRRDPATELKAE